MNKMIIDKLYTKTIEKQPQYNLKKSMVNPMYPFHGSNNLLIQ